ncbi:transcriptional regulator [Companilactobacillus sp. RD055328]|uniref:type IV toxin-antitoxin system AbiEi family antitoxin domain-containing protein n=1 Tax=Companilactobacillus sp. RD055328 TaxID=2916634 RepID=UPI001FC7CA36|nr:type IV toxin-antitoxin system AbiEi family antitoxin domain-containing protein [Companilactobacillus sp. RD055328]GKQ42466.1 transcriptional regulator [Companilactobacillus sp. RD055328]
MTQKKEIREFLRKNKGQITLSDVRNLGISTKVLSRMFNDNEVYKLTSGVYIDPEEFGDELKGLQYRFNKGIYYRSTSLFLHGMIDRTPSFYEMNFPNSYFYPSNIEEPLKMYRQELHLYKIGIESIETPRGNEVLVYNIERTLCDIIRKRNRLDPETIKQAVNYYAKYSGKNVHKLVEYSKIFKVESEIENYMDVLL